MNYAEIITVGIAHASGESIATLVPGRVCPLTLIHSIASKVGELIGQTPLDAAEILTSALQVYDRYVQPFEVRGYGQIYEREVDSNLRDSLTIVLHSLADRLVP